ncbi:hypothetical protein BurJ1DRAFT_3483 [Burkholderiales bacterium JOSHI_001]|nr:hypothetical protein BurJ1DRAFT_3483 [Burkholderiales bacterium JOSHI_001]
MQPRLVFSFAALALLGAAAVLLAGEGAAAATQGWLHWGLGQRDNLLGWHAREPVAFTLVFVAMFVLLSATTLPGCSVLAFAAGPCYGWFVGTLLVVLSSTVGATIPFLLARHLWRERLRARAGPWLARVDAGLARDGLAYLFFLRMAPVIPYPLLNPLLGLTSLRLWPFTWVSALGMTAGSAAYVQAGRALLAPGEPLLSPALLAALAVIGLLPWALRRWWRLA